MPVIGTASRVLEAPLRGAVAAVQGQGVAVLVSQNLDLQVTGLPRGCRYTHKKVCECACVHIYMHLHAHTRIYIYIHICRYVCIYLFIQLCIHINT